MDIKTKNCCNSPDLIFEIPFVYSWDIQRTLEIFCKKKIFRLRFSYVCHKVMVVFRCLVDEKYSMYQIKHVFSTSRICSSRSVKFICWKALIEEYHHFHLLEISAKTRFVSCLKARMNMENGQTE